MSETLEPAAPVQVDATAPVADCREGQPETLPQPAEAAAADTAAAIDHARIDAALNQRTDEIRQELQARQDEILEFLKIMLDEIVSRPRAQALQYTGLTNAEVKRLLRAYEAIAALEAITWARGLDFRKNT